MVTSRWPRLQCFFPAMRLPLRAIWLALMTFTGIVNADAGGILAGQPLKVAVAANFKPLLQQLKSDFEQQHGHPVLLSSASTGVLYAQITHGGPFDVFLAADAERPKRLQQQQFIVPGSRQTYGLGRLVLLAQASGQQGRDQQGRDQQGRDQQGRGQQGRDQQGRDQQGRGQQRRDQQDQEQDQQWLGLLSQWPDKIAIANVKTAPYGLATKQVLEQLGLWQSKRSQLVEGSNIAQTHQFFESGNVKLAFVAYSQVQQVAKDHYWLLPQTLYEPIKQQLVVLKISKQPRLAEKFVQWLLSDPVQQKIVAAGYGGAKDTQLMIKTEKTAVTATHLPLMVMP